MDDIDGARMARATLAKLERPESPRTAAATAARRRQGEERAAARLRERGWLAVPPEYVIIEPGRVTIKDRALSVGAGHE